MTNHRAMRLGKLPRKHDRRTLKLANYLTPGFTPPTAHWDTRIAPTGWGMMANDTVGDCTCATAGHMLQAWTSSDAPHAILTASDEQILAAYSAVTGYNPNDPNSDQGAYCLDVLNYWRHTGIANHQIVAYMQVDPTNDAEVRTAIWAFGGCYLGLALPIIASTQDVWKVPVCRWCGKSRPGSWGGHAVPLVAYNKTRLWCITWGEAKQLTYGFLHRYCVAPETRVLTDDLRWVPAGDLVEGEGLLAFDEEASSPRGDHGGNGRRWRRSVVESAPTIRRPCYDLTFSDGTTVRCSADHRWLAHNDGAARWLTTEALRCHGPHLASNIVKPLDVWEEDLSRDGGYLAAALDGEGSLIQRDLTHGEKGVAHTQLTFNQRSNAMLDRVCAALKERGLVFSERSFGGKNGDVTCLTIGRRADVLRALGSLRPHRLLAKFQPDLLGQMTSKTVKLVEKVPVGEQDVVALKTTTGTFLAEGLASHNCDEAYAILSVQWTGPDRLSPSGFDYDALLRDLNTIGA